MMRRYNLFLIQDQTPAQAGRDDVDEHRWLVCHHQSGARTVAPTVAGAAGWIAAQSAMSGDARDQGSASARHGSGRA
jgi:hypothetical protein